MFLFIMIYIGQYTVEFNLKSNQEISVDVVNYGILETDFVLITRVFCLVTKSFLIGQLYCIKIIDLLCSTISLFLSQAV